MHASNTPVSRPIPTRHRIDADFGGIKWSKKGGFVFAPEGEMLPFRKPISERPGEMTPPRRVR